MRDKTKIMLKKIHDLLMTNEYLTAKDIADRCNFKVCSTYRAIKLLRINGIGIIPTKKGYVIAEFAKKPDDVYFIRKCYGRRASDILAMSTAKRFIEKRWRGIEEKNNIVPAIDYVLQGEKTSERVGTGIKYLLSSINGKGN